MTSSVNSVNTLFRAFSPHRTAAVEMTAVAKAGTEAVVETAAVARVRMVEVAKAAATALKVAATPDEVTASGAASAR